MAGSLRAIGIDVRGQGFGYAVLEGSERLIDWGGAKVPRLDVSIFLAKLDALMVRFRVDVVVLEEPAGSARLARARSWLAWAEQTAAERGSRAVVVSREAFLEAFSESGSTRWEIAVALTRQFPELAPLLPPRKRRWGLRESDQVRTLIAAARTWVGLISIERGGDESTRRLSQ
jgi:hypothetical protein